MRRVIALLAIGAAIAACRDRPAPTENRAGPEFAVGGNGHGNGPSRVISNGIGVFASWSSGDSASGTGSTSVYLNANQVDADSMGAGGMLVYWWVTKCDATWYCVYSGGGGRLPLSVLTSRAHDYARLAFDPADYPGALWMEGDSLGPVDVTWTRNRSYTSTNTSTQEVRWPTCWYRVRGTSEETGAGVAGQATPWVVPAGVNGSIYTRRQTELTFCR